MSFTLLSILTAIWAFISIASAGFVGTVYERRMGREAGRTAAGRMFTFMLIAWGVIVAAGQAM